MKKTFCLILSIILFSLTCLSLYSCSNTESNSDDADIVTVTFYKNNMIAFENGSNMVKKQYSSDGVYKVQNVFQGTYMSPPEDPTELKAGVYLFGGWYKEPSCENAFDFNSEPINTNINLYAKWIKINPLVVE